MQNEVWNDGPKSVCFHSTGETWNVVTTATLPMCTQAKEIKIKERRETSMFDHQCLKRNVTNSKRHNKLCNGMIHLWAVNISRSAVTCLTHLKFSLFRSLKSKCNSGMTELCFRTDNKFSLAACYLTFVTQGLPAEWNHSGRMMFDCETIMWDFLLCRKTHLTVTW